MSVTLSSLLLPRHMCVVHAGWGEWVVSQLNETAVSVVRKLMQTHHSASLYATNGIVDGLIVRTLLPFLPSFLRSFLLCLHAISPYRPVVTMLKHM